jgi:hypothetical protein
VLCIALLAIYLPLASIKMNTTKRNIVWLLASIGLLFSLFWTFVDLTETFGILSGKNLESYPWGYGNSVPWYYADSKTYWIYCLISGLVNLIASIVIINGMIKKNLKRMIIGFIITMTVFLILIISIYLIEPAA